jgi:hypothetical protein
MMSARPILTPSTPIKSAPRNGLRISDLTPREMILMLHAASMYWLDNSFAAEP